MKADIKVFFCFWSSINKHNISKLFNN